MMTFVRGCNLEQKELRVLGHANPPIKNQSKDQQPKFQDRGAQKGGYQLLHKSRAWKACTNHNKNKATKVEIGFDEKLLLVSKDPILLEGVLWAGGDQPR